MSTVNDSKPVDLRVDAAFGEPVVFKPMMTQQSGYRERVPDPSRVEVIAVGIYDDSRGAVEGFGTASTVHRQASVDILLSIRYEPIKQCNLQKGDRVFFPDRNETHEVTFIYPEAAGRWDVHMVRVLDDYPVINP
ncbi:MAG TPA: hypothetical protein VFP43_02880 [Mesorhizobium sp.]|nr:hypothetical protein [Mesorhizobium sp.]